MKMAGRFHITLLTKGYGVPATYPGAFCFACLQSHTDCNRGWLQPPVEILRPNSPTLC